MLTVTVSLAIVWEPPPLGTTSTLTVPLLVSKLITDEICELIVVEVVKAETTAVAAINNRLHKTINENRWTLLFGVGTFIFYKDPLIVVLHFVKASQIIARVIMPMLLSPISIGGREIY